MLTQLRFWKKYEYNKVKELTNANKEAIHSGKSQIN